MTKFYDTSSLLLDVSNLHNEEHFIISSITLQELENIKTSSRKDADVKYNARLALNYLDTADNYTVHIFNLRMLDPIVEKDLEVSNDTKILATAFDYDNTVNPDNTIFMTNDLALKNIANLFFGEDSIQSVNEDDLDTYCGYVEIDMDDQELSEFYSAPTDNKYNILPH